MATERPKITSLRFDHDGWTLREQTPREAIGSRELQVRDFRQQQSLSWPAGWTEGAFDLLPSDDQEYDELSPRHPLTVVRRTLRQIHISGRIDDCIKLVAQRC